MISSPNAGSHRTRDSVAIRPMNGPFSKPSTRDSGTSSHQNAFIVGRGSGIEATLLVPYLFHLDAILTLWLVLCDAKLFEVDVCVVESGRGIALVISLLLSESCKTCCRSGTTSCERSIGLLGMLLQEKLDLRPDHVACVVDLNSSCLFAIEVDLRDVWDLGLVFRCGFRLLWLLVVVGGIGLSFA